VIEGKVQDPLQKPLERPSETLAPPPSPPPADTAASLAQSTRQPASGRDFNIFLIGLMGAGKTTVGRALAKRLGRPFFDSDHEIEARTGVRIPLIFEHEGEEGFRQRESDALDELTQRHAIVLATGGGAPLRAGNRAWLSTRGYVFYLRAQPHDLWLRTRRDKNRPLLQTEDPRARIEGLFAQRDPIYRDCAHFVIETGRPSINSLVGNVLMQLEMAGLLGPPEDAAAPDPK
jgi:shikimate kinase